MDIRPTLFIGLGTSGVNIIQKFRRLMFEQFTEAGLPIFRYLGIETDGDSPAQKSDLPEEYALKDYERIAFLPAMVPIPAAVLNLLDNPHYAQMRRWLNPALLKPELAVLDGARSIRMLGRLALWMNWNDIRTALINMKAPIVSPNTGQKNQSQSIIQNRLKLPPGSVQIQPEFDVYIMGTLCGGTCGGMLIDIAYQVQKLLGMTNVLPAIPTASYSRIYAILTILDNDLANAPPFQRNAANCWASMLELDWYMDERTSYDYILPNDASAPPNYYAPVTFIELVSRTNRLNEKFSGNIAHFRGEDINEMIALHIFNNIFTGVGVSLAAVAADGVAGGRRKLNDRERTRTMRSFGATALWNPKYKLAQAFAAYQAGVLCDHLTGGLDQARLGIIEQLAKDHWNTIRTNCLKSLTAMPGTTTIEGSLKGLLEPLEHQTQSVDVSRLSAFLQTYPPTEPPSIKDRFRREGPFGLTMSNMSGHFNKIIADEVGKLIYQLFNGIDPSVQNVHSRTILNLQELIIFINKLQALIREDTQGVPPVLPDFVFSPRSVSPGISLSNSPWLSMLGKGGQASGKYKSQIIQDFRAEVDRHFKACRRYFALEGLSNVADNVLSHKLGEVNLCLNSLSSVKDSLAMKVEMGKMSDSTDSSNIRALGDTTVLARLISTYSSLDGGTKGGHLNSILTQIPSKDGSVKQRTWNDLLNLDAKKIEELVTYPFFTWALSQDDGVNLIDKALELFANDNTLMDLARRSFPYVAMNEKHQSIRDSLPGTYEYLCGKQPVTGNKTLHDLLAHITRKKPAIIFKPHPSPLDNVVVFYREEAPFFIDDLEAANLLENRYQLCSAPDDKDLHTEKDREFCNKGILVHLRPIQLRIEGIQWLYPYEAFVKYGNGYYLKYTKPGGISDSCTMTTELDRSEFCIEIARGLARGDAAAHSALKALEDRIRAVLNEHGRQAALDRFDQLQTEWLDQAIDKEEMDRRKKPIIALIEDVFPDTKSGAAS